MLKEPYLFSLLYPLCIKIKQSLENINLVILNLFIFVYFDLTRYLFTLLDQSFTGWPNAVSSYQGESTTLTWTISEPITTKWYSIVTVYNK